MILDLSHPFLSSPCFSSCSGPRLAFLLGCVTIPRWCLGGYSVGKDQCLPFNGQAGTTQTPSEERKSPCSCLTRTQKSLGCYQGQRGELEQVSGIQEGKDYRIRGAELPGRGCPVGLAGGVTPGPQEVQWRRKMDGRGAGGCWFWFHPDDMVERDRSGPNFLLFANFSKYVLKMTPKPFLCYPPILPVPAHSR